MKVETEAELRARLAGIGLHRVADQIVKMVRPCYRIERSLVPEEQILPGHSRFGGSPDLPAGWTWPQVPASKQTEPMEFVGQIRLADLPQPVPETVPLDGLVSFFIRWSESQVFYHPETTVLESTAAPFPPVPPAPSGFVARLVGALKRNADPLQTYRPCAMRFVQALSLPDPNSARIRQLKLSAEDFESYAEFFEESLSGDTTGVTNQHQMFGYAHQVQNEMELECDFIRRGQEVRWDLPPERFISAANDWVLLLQVDTDDSKEGPGWMWGDAGMVYFWIHREDLAARAFHRTVCLQQCY